jgi:MFS family permease
VVSLGSGAFPKECRGTGTAIILGFTDFGSLLFAPILGRIIDTYGFRAMYLTSSGTALTVAIGYMAVALWHADEEATGHAGSPSVASNRMSLPS